MSRRKQLNPRPLGEYARTKSQEPTSQDQGEIHKKTSRNTFNEHMVASDEDEENYHLMIDEANGARIPPDHFPLPYTYYSSLTCPIPTTSTGPSSCSSPQNPFSNGEASPMTGSSETLGTMKGKKHPKVPVKRKSGGKILPTGKDGQHGYVCPQCDTFVSSQHELTTHLRSHNGVNNSRSEHQCHQCWKILSSSSSLDRHMLTHSGEKPFSCRICKQSFTTNGNMHRHMRTHEKKNEQRRVAALLKPKNKSSSKMDLFNESMVDVPTNKTSLRLPENVEIVSQNSLKTKWPSSTLTNINKKPASDSREDLNSKPSFPPCQNEGHDLSQKPMLKNAFASFPQPPAETSLRHSVHSSPTSSPLNSITAVEFSSSKFPLICIVESSKNGCQPEVGQQEYGCNTCSKSLLCKTALDLHLKSHYTDQQICCSMCDLAFLSPEEYQQHYYRYHTDGDDKFQAFMNSLNLVSNQNTPKMAESPPPLPQSSMNGIDEGSLAKQCQLLDEDTKPGSVSPQLQIDEPSSKQDIKPILPIHNEGHLNDNSLCISANDADVSQDESNNAGSYISIATEKAFNGTLKKKSSFTCTYCNKDFINTRAAKSHERSHLGLSPYQCKSCSYSSPDKSTLIRHMRTHNGERPYQCKLCNYAFTTKANCERHVKKKHNISKKEELETKVGYNKNTKEAQDDSFSSPDTVCKYCNKDFKYFRRLKHHLRGHRSSEEKPFKCKQCEMGFSTKANCVRHIQNKHTEISHVNIENYVQMQESMLKSFMGHSGSPRCTSAPPPAHSPAVRFSDDSAEDAKPLDLRSSRNLSQSNSPSVNGNSYICCDKLDNNEPIDLSVKRTKKAARKVPEIPESNMQCLYCDQEFSSDFDRQYHMKMSHDPIRSSGDRMSWQKQTTSHYVSHSPAVSLQENCSTPLTKKIKLESNSHKNHTQNIDCDSDDLASVRQILYTTGSNSFEAYFSKHQDDVMPSSGQANGYNSSPSEYGNDGPQIKDEPRDLEDNDYAGVLPEDSNLNNSSDAKDISLQEPEVDSVQKSQKKKRNSYADSPHKLKCPHCPRHFPWASSLNRHILTHTGEKPFECPKCHVIFSTKSNRERHLTRKHGVNMLDPAARQTMDRPFKCHLCTFSSFATKENLLRHYRDRHPEDPLPEGICDSAEKSSSSGSSPQQQKTKFHSGSSNISMELKSPDSAKKNLPTECSGLIPSKMENSFQDDHGNKSEELEEINNNQLHWSQKSTDLQANNLTSKTHLCYLCGYKLNSEQLLQQHLKFHSKDLPFKCHQCNGSFHERNRCLRHVEEKHVAEWTILTNKNNITNIEQFSDDVAQRCQEYVKQLSDCMEQNSLMTDYLDKKVYCSFCIERFWSTQDLCHHMHSGCQLTKKESIIPSTQLSVTTLPRASSDFSANTEEADILPTMLGMDTSSIDVLLDRAVSGRFPSYIP